MEKVEAVRLALAELGEASDEAVAVFVRECRGGVAAGDQSAVGVARDNYGGRWPPEA